MIMIVVTSNYIIVWVSEPTHLCLCSSFALWIAHLALCFHLCKGKDGKMLSSLNCDKVSCCLTLVQGSWCWDSHPKQWETNGSSEDVQRLIIFSFFFFLKYCVPEAPLHVKGVSCPQEWPQCGEIVFQNYQMKYRDNTPIVLRDINLKIPGQETVGIVGRTGSGELSIWGKTLSLILPLRVRALCGGGG